MLEFEIHLSTKEPPLRLSALANPPLHLPYRGRGAAESELSQDPLPCRLVLVVADKALLLEPIQALEPFL